MTAAERRLAVIRWAQVAVRVLDTAERAFEAQDFRSAASRAYYAAYQAATSHCIAHRDEGHFPPGWNNPSHDQLPELIRNNGARAVGTRRLVAQSLLTLRAAREDADYRPIRTVDRSVALDCINRANHLLELLETENAGTDAP